MGLKIKDREFNDYEREPVPDFERKGWFRLSLVWLGIAIALSATMLGGTLGSGLTLMEAVAVAVFGSLILAIISALCSIVGAKTGLSTGFVSRFALGKYGSYAVSIIVATSLFGWFGVQIDLFGASMQNVIFNATGVEVSQFWLTIGGGILMTLTAVIGYKAIEKLSILAVPLMIFLLLASLVRVIMDTGISGLDSANSITEPLSLGLGISLVIGSLATGAVIAPDISRYAKSAKQASIAAFLGFLVGFSSVLIIAAILAKATGSQDIVSIMIGLGWGSAAMMILILAQWTTNDSNLYSSALGFSVMIKKVPKWQLTIVAGSVGILMAVFGIYNHFTSFLMVLSALIPPIGGVYVADYIQNPKKYRFEKIAHTNNVNFIGVSSWIVGSSVAFMTMPAPIGLEWFTITNAAGIDAILVAFVTHFIISKLLVVRAQVNNKQIKGSF